MDVVVEGIGELLLKWLLILEEGRFAFLEMLLAKLENVICDFEGTFVTRSNRNCADNHQQTACSSFLSDQETTPFFLLSQQGDRALLKLRALAYRRNIAPRKGKGKGGQKDREPHG